MKSVNEIRRTIARGFHKVEKLRDTYQGDECAECPSVKTCTKTYDSVCEYLITDFKLPCGNIVEWQPI